MILGLDIGGTKCAAILGLMEDDKVRIIDRYVVKTRCDYRAIVNDLMQWALRKELTDDFEVSHVGISCGGPLSVDRRMILSPPNLPGWDRVPIISMVKDCFKREVVVKMENDADACALAEWHFGAGKNTNNMIFLTFGTGLGAGLILNKRLYRGSSGMAGEVGHIRLSEDGPIGYGKRGSLEGYASGGGIKQLAENAGFLQENLSAKTVIEAAFSGDESAAKILQESGERLGQGLAVLIDVLNPECIVIGSIFARAEKFIRPHMEAVIRKECLSGTLNAVRIVPAGLGEQIGDYGAICAAMNNGNGEI